MKKICFCLVAFIALNYTVSAQAYEGSIQFDKKKQDAIVIEYAYPAEAVENAFVQKMEALGYRAKEEKGFLNKDKGFLVFKNAYVNDISDKKMDYIVKVERKSRKESDESIMYIIMQNDGGENALKKLESYDVGRAKSFVNNLIPDIESANLELQIKAQQESIAKAEKKLRDLQDEKQNLERKLDENIKNQENTQKDIEAQRRNLEVLTGKRRSGI
jgi:hypothetical protein